MKTLKIIVIIIVILFLIPVVSWLLWSFQSSRPLNILILNKTVLGFERKEQKGLFWLLNNEKFVKSDNKPYNINRDYFGFHPLKPLKSKKYDVKRIKLMEIDNLSAEFDMTYYVDTYGVFFNEWYRGRGTNDRGTLIQGGVNNNDFLFLKKMIEEDKLIIVEYNFFGKPTVDLVRKKTEDMLGVEWSSWIGTYVHNLNIKNSSELPIWMVDIYKNQHNGEWPFKGSGIVLFNEGRRQIIVLEEDKHLDIAVPEIQTTEYGMENFNLPEKVHYPYWFDIVSNIADNKIVADFKLHITLEGKSVLDNYNLPSRFPAIIQSGNQSSFYYFSGDFVDFPVKIYTARLRGIRTFERMFYSNKPHNRSKFYWTYYIPLLSEILSDYQETLDNN